MLRQLGVRPYCLRISGSGHPEHPLRLPASCRLQRFTGKAAVPARKLRGSVDFLPDVRLPKDLVRQTQEQRGFAVSLSLEALLVRRAGTGIL